jgi:methylamine dehydrogenase heavy chain
VVKRLLVEGHPTVLNVTQEASPKLVVVAEGEGAGAGAGFPGDANVIDPATGEIKHNIKDAGSGLVQVIQ